MKKNSITIKKVIFVLFMTVLALFFVFPLIWMVMSSFKNDAQIFKDINGLSAFTITSFHENPFFNYQEVLGKIPLIRAALNSFFYITIIIVLGMTINSMAGYAFARIKFAKRDLIFNIILTLMIIPVQTIMLPQFSIIYRLGWTNSYMGLIVPALANPLYIFLFRQNFLGLPETIEEAAQIDGASRIRIFFQLVVPLAKPVYGTVAILTFIQYWNDFIWPVMVITDTRKYTVQMSLNSLFAIKPVNYGNVMAGLTFITIPVLIIFLCMQKYYVQGIASTGAKN
ncbi:carbohydrate ABC transporter permease [Lacrimispora sp. 38-1]|uniref:carbohydrate ABC transporter permease n=1 Tax=Lacrimispora sp. 38-1 TaxID=3125778 RepID=UPI003CE90F71